MSCRTSSVVRGACLGLALLASCDARPPGMRSAQPRAMEPCRANRQPVHYEFTGWPPHGLMLDDETFGAASSWTHEGYPPAGDRCSLPPPGVTVPPNDVASEK